MTQELNNPMIEQITLSKVAELLDQASQPYTEGQNSMIYTTLTCPVPEDSKIFVGIHVNEAKKELHIAGECDKYQDMQIEGMDDFTEVVLRCNKVNEHNPNATGTIDYDLKLVAKKVFILTHPVSTKYVLENCLKTTLAGIQRFFINYTEL